MHFKHTIFALLIYAFFATGAGAAEKGPALQAEGYRLDRAPIETMQTLLLSPPGKALLKTISLPPPDESEYEALIQRNQQQKLITLGIGRAVPNDTQQLTSDQLQWKILYDGSHVAHVQVQSQGASAIRAGINSLEMPKGVELRFYAPADPGEVFGPYDAVTMRDRLGQAAETPIFWSPVFEGDTLAMEIHVAVEASLDTIRLRLPMLSHLYHSPANPSLEKELSGIGSSGACNIDIACDPSWVETGRSVAKYAFTTAQGKTSLCTGTLLTDRSRTGTLYFLTANHCISTQAVASTVQTYWFFERQSCGGADPTAVTTVTPGSTLLATGGRNFTDFTLLQLAAIPPSGVLFAGWDPAPVAAGTAITGLHHPRGDLKKVSQGTVQGISNYSQSVDDDPNGRYIRVGWTSGTTEPGSSGSALFQSNRLVIGNLRGGGAACAGNVGNNRADWYGRFDLTYNCITEWLGGPPAAPCANSATPPSTRSASALTAGSPVSGSVDAGQWIDYQLTIAAGTTRLTVDLSGLTADGDLYVRRGSLPELSTYDCRPFEDSGVSENCVIDNPVADTWFIGVNGFSATDYTLAATVDGGAAPSGGGGSQSPMALIFLLGLLVARTGWSYRSSRC